VDFARSKELEMTKRISAPPLPTDHADVLSWLETVIPATFAALDDKAKMGAEGVVVRSMDRKTISKIRFSDYRRTLKRK